MIADRHLPKRFHRDEISHRVSQNGDFSNLRDANGNLITIYDPLTVQANGSRQQFSGNKILSSRFNPVGVKLLSYYPNPNTTPTNINSNSSNYLTETSAYNVQNEWSVKIDYDMNEKNKFFGTTYSADPPPRGEYEPAGLALTAQLVQLGVLPNTLAFPPP